MGANDFSMGIMGPTVAYLAYRGCMKLKMSMLPTVFIVAFLADWFTYLHHRGSAGSCLSNQRKHNDIDGSTFMGIYAVTQIPLSIAESVLMIMFLTICRGRGRTLSATSC